MRWTLATAVVLFPTLAHAADDVPEAAGVLDGKRVHFPEKSIAAGVNATVGLLESCHDESPYQADELESARKGDHVRLAFPEPVTATVMGKKVHVGELVFRLPLNTGVFWVRSGDTWRRFTKYEFPQQKPFEVWLREARLTERTKAK